MTEIVLVVVAHSDDESISMAGTITRHVSRGDKVFVVSMTDGVGARDSTNIDDANSRKVSADTASKRVKPSVGTLAICASKLQHYGRCMTATEQHTQLGKRFSELSEQCHKQINNVAVGWWKDEVRV